MRIMSPRSIDCSNMRWLTASRSAALKPAK